MAKTPYLLRRNGKCYFRIKVPSHLKKTLNKNEIKVSLRTSDLKLAKQRIPLHLLEAQQLFSNAEKELIKLTNQNHSNSSSDISNIELERIVALWFQELEQQSEEYDYSARVSMSADERYEVLDSLREDLAGYESESENVIGPAVQPQAEKLLIKHNLRLEISDKQFHYLCTLIQRALIQHTYNRLSIYGDMYKRQSDRLFQISHTTPISKVTVTTKDVMTITWKVVLKRFTEVKKSEGVTDKTLASYKLIKDFTSEFFGSDRDIKSINTALCRDLIKQLSQLPSNARKHHPNLSLIQATKLPLEAISKRLSATSISNQMQYLSTIFAFAVNEGWIDRNPMSGIKRIKANHSETTSREPFTVEELNKLFRSSIYRSERAPYRSHKFWIPLLSLYSGMRLNEICQLFAHDIEIIEGIPVMHLRVDADGIKSFKNKSSLRTVPIHPELQRLGFVDFALEAQNRLQKLLFSDIKPSAAGSYSDNFSKWFGRTLRSEGLKRNGLVFHSFRHTFRDAARNNNLNREITSKIGGWSVSDDVMDRYGKGHSIQKLYEEISKITYQGLDLSHLGNVMTANH